MFVISLASMFTGIKKRLREDLIVTPVYDEINRTQNYSIKDPVSGETFEFGEEEYFLCQAIQGEDAEFVLSSFSERFSKNISKTDLEQFIGELDGLGLMANLSQSELLSKKDSAQPLVSPNGEATIADSPDVYVSRTNGNGHSSGTAALESTPAENVTSYSSHVSSTSPKKASSSKAYLWAPKNPARLFEKLADFTRLFVWPIRFLLVGLILTLPIAFLTFINNQALFWRDMGLFVTPLPFFTAYAFNIVVANLAAKSIQGIVAAAHGAQIKDFGFTLALGFYPRFSLGRRQLLSLPRPAQLWVFSVPLLFRLVLFVVGMIVWFANRHSATSLDVWALLTAHAAIVTFVLIACPFWPVDGYYWIVNFLNLPRNLLGQTFTLWSLLLRGRRLPSTMSWSARLGYLLFGIMALAFMLFVIGGIAWSFSEGLANTFPNIFGRSTRFIFLGIVPLLIALRLVGQWRKTRNQSYVRSDATTLTGYQTPSLLYQIKRGISSGIKLSLLFILVLLMLLPYHSRPGGQLELLPPNQRQIQAKVEGTISRVMFKGGDGEWIAAGRVIAVMEAYDIENEKLTRAQQIEAQQAAVANQQSLLNKLLSTPRPEEVSIARQRVEVARRSLEKAEQETSTAMQEVEVFRQTLNTAAARADFSLREAERYQDLLQQGAVSQQDFEDRQRRASVDETDLAEQKQRLKVSELDVESARREVEQTQQQLAEEQAQLQLVLQGPHPDDVQAARGALAAAQAELRRFQQELQYDQEQLQRTHLHMPVDGRIVTPYLDRKVGSFLDEGDVFAVVEDDRNIFGELLIPEENTEDIQVGAEVEIRLLAYPKGAIFGSVTEIDPSANTFSSSSDNAILDNSRMVRVIVNIPETDQLLKAGMTGYAKVDGKTRPLIIAFLRPLIRFFQIEFWSWIP
ncbi:MAG: HlyD family efflux transporter periplasmic adaptor subunit [Leptolyngbyaceae cyanobacterium MAG.088]|nr:HlyD family efflux transporter periplasmic adaptor subunit [Leptolyngbyaceae cyanobacterium MAG.088]